MKNGNAVILYVEDDPDYREGVRAIIESGGYEVIEASNAEEGLRVFRANEPDLVIVDLMMEEVDSGTNLIKELRALQTTIPIYMMTSVGDSLTMSKSPAELGLDGVLQKPVNRDTLLGLLRSKLRS